MDFSTAEYANFADFADFADLHLLIFFKLGCKNTRVLEKIESFFMSPRQISRLGTKKPDALKHRAFLYFMLLYQYHIDPLSKKHLPTYCQHLHYLSTPFGFDVHHILPHDGFFIEWHCNSWRL